MGSTWECGPTKWLEEYVDPFSNSKMARTVEADLPHVIGEVYTAVLWVQLLEVATNSESVLVNVKIGEWTWNDADPCLVYTSNVVIQVGDYSQFSVVNTDFSGTNPNCHKSPGDNLEWTWRVYCDDAIYSSRLAEFHICDYYDHTGPGPGPAGDPLLAAQYFDTTLFGYTGGCITRCITDNPRHGGGKNTVPTQVEWNLYAWNTDYSTTIDGISLATDTFIIPSEKIRDDFIQIPFFWDDLFPGKYMWTLECVKGPHDGSFQLEYWDKSSAQKWAAWVNGVLHDNFNSKILGIETSETWEKIMGVDDTFNNHYYEGVDGQSTIKINTPNGYKNVLSLKTGCNHVKRSVGLLEGENLSFETSDFTGWNTYSHHSNTITVSDEWSTDGTYSAKCYMAAWNPYTTGVYMYQYLNGAGVAPGWRLMWDMYAFGSGTYRLIVYSGSHIIYSHPISNGEFFDVTTDITSWGYLHFVTEYYCCTIQHSKTLYIDNIRLVPPSGDPTPIGRIVGGASNIRDAT